MRLCRDVGISSNHYSHWSECLQQMFVSQYHSTFRCFDNISDRMGSMFVAAGTKKPSQYLCTRRNAAPFARPYSRLFVSSHTSARVGRAEDAPVSLTCVMAHDLCASILSVR
mmetsp:Transcript_24858/g.68864  ORF Transcript_24858/g.68864 Transcript_24858/m.68864 type:complete len:112 (-) Transcript_24858:44-379(-)